MAMPLKPQYGPTLGRLLAPRWRSASPGARALAVAAGVALLALVVAATLTLLTPTYSHGGPVPISFGYRGLYRTTPDPGGYVKVARSSGGRLRDSFEVAPLRIPPYAGDVGGELPLLASAYVRTLSARFPGFTLQGEGKTWVTPSLSGYDIRYQTVVGGRRMYGRDVFFLPNVPRPRSGVAVEMLTTTRATVSKPVGSRGVLEGPLTSFKVG